MEFFQDPFSSLALLCCIVFAIQLSVCAVSWKQRTEKFYDLTGSATFVLIICLSYYWAERKSFRQSLHAVLVILWAVRLGSYLFMRILKFGHDRRFSASKKHCQKFYILWILQGIWIIITVLPTLMLMFSRQIVPFTSKDFCGYGLWSIGFTIEVVADNQKMAFRNKPQNKDKFITSGLWYWSRHPNYCGEILMWFGLFVSVASVLQGLQLFTVFCPIFNVLLITKFSGIPPLEENGMHRWGHNPKYLDYVRTTKILIPFVW